MTDIQLPLHQSHQKGMNGNGKYLAKNTLEIRGGGVGTNNSSNINDPTSPSKILNTNASNNVSSTGLINKPSSASNSKKSPINKFIEKNQTNLANIQVYPRLIDSTYSTIVSFNLFDVKSNNNSNNNMVNSNNSNNKNRNSTTNKIPKFDINSNSLTNLSQLSLNSNNNNNITLSNSNSFNSNNDNNNNSSNNQNRNFSKSHSNNWHDESNSGWASTGVMSDRSSVYSIDDGDFDREASRKVNNQLREIESILYEQNSTHSSILVECKEWLEKFPHIRILGSQLSNSHKDDFHLSNDNLRSSVQSVPSTYRNISSNLTGVTSIPKNLSENTSRSNFSPTVIETATPPKSISNENSAPTFSNYKFSRRREQSDLNNQNLYLNGICMPIRKLDKNLTSEIKSPLSSSTELSELSLTTKIETPSVDYSFLTEEIFEEDGTYEELLAYDNQEEEYLFEHNKRLNLSKRRRHGLPPITPKASMKDLVTNFLFDHMWSELINWSSDIIQTYAKTISEDFVSDSSCKTPQPIDSNKYDNKENQPSPNIINNNNNSFHINTSNSTQQNSLNNFNSNTNNSNLHVNTSSLTTTLTKANVVQLKPFDSALNSTNANTNIPFYHLLEKQSLSSGLLSRDNSTLYAQSSKYATNDNQINSNYTGSDSTSNVGDLLSGNIDDILKIKQLNRNGSININKNLTPINTHYNQSRIGSGSTNRRQHQIANNFRKRYSSIEMSTNTLLDKNIIIHGAGLVKPTSLNHLNDSHSTSSANDIKPSINTSTTANSTFLPLANNNNSNLNGHQIFISNSNQHSNNRSANSSTQAYHHQINEDNTYENDYNDFNYNNENNNNNNNVNANESIDEINLLNPNNSINFNRNSYYYNSHSNHFNYGYFNNSINNRNHSTNYQPLPPIENSLTFKPMRISSANALKQTKERTERPLTSTATRLDSNTTPLNKRSSTPSGMITSGNKALNNLYTNNMKITGIRLSAEDPLYSGNNQASNSLNNYLSTKSFASIGTNNSNSTVFSNLNYNNSNTTSTTGSNGTTNIIQIGLNNHHANNRRNSIKDAQQNLLRLHK